MNNVLIHPSVLRGTVRVPASKSAAHRVLITSSLAGNQFPIPPSEALSDDLLATRDALSVLMNPANNGPLSLDCRESGSTLRFLIPVAAALGRETVFSGTGRLPERPIGIYLDLLPQHGVTCETTGGLPLSIRGKLRPGVFALPGNVSSQFITGLMLALPLLEGDSRIELTAPLESADYVGMTVRILENFGVTVRPCKNGWTVPGNQTYLANPDYRIERDWSQAAFFLAAGALGGHVSLEELLSSSCQGDREAEALFRRFGARLNWNGGLLTAEASDLNGIDIDASQIPDLVPILTAVAVTARGRTVIHHAERLRLKESDRLTAMADGLNRLGANVTETPGGLVIEGIQRLHGGTVSGYHDHRIVMALSIAALNASEEVRITGAQCIRKSYPDFFRDYNRLGGKAYVMGE